MADCDDSPESLSAALEAWDGQQMVESVIAPSGNPLCTRPVRIAIVDDHRMLLDTLGAWIQTAEADVQVAIQAPTWSELLEDPGFPVDVVLLDLDLGDHIPAPVKIVTLRSAGVATVVMSAHADAAEVRACVAAGALAYLRKTESADDIVNAVVMAAAGESYLTPGLAALLVADRQQLADDPRTPALSPQETKALILYASNLPMKSVARRLGVSFDTAKGYMDRVREKYALAGREARTKIELHRRAVEDGYLNHRD